MQDVASNKESKMLQYLYYIGISFVVSLLVSVVTLWVYHKHFRQRNDNNESVSKSHSDSSEKYVNQESQGKLNENGSASSTQFYTEAQANYGSTDKNKSGKEESRKKSKNKKEKEDGAKPEDGKYVYMKPLEGKLVEISNMHQTSYYRSWKEDGKRYYEFSCKEKDVSMAINNRGSLIDPFCIKSPDSVNPDEAKKVETISPGIMDESYSITKKTTVKYT